jgi:hypothetical protein
MFAKNDFIAWLIGAYGFYKDAPYGDIEFHWPNLVLTLFGLGGVSGIWAQIANYNMMKDNIDEIINVEIVKEAGKVLADMNTSDGDDISMNTRLSKFKKDLKNLIKECKYDVRKGNNNNIGSRIQKLQHDAERVLSNPNNRESLQALVNSINSVFEVCLDKNKVAEAAKNAKK